MYAICAAILIIVQAWAIWNEVVGKRPWKDYQRKFYSLLIDNINDDIEEEKRGLMVLMFKRISGGGAETGKGEKRV